MIFLCTGNDFCFELKRLAMVFWNDVQQLVRMLEFNQYVAQVHFMYFVNEKVRKSLNIAVCVSFVIVFMKFSIEFVFSII